MRHQKLTHDEHIAIARAIAKCQTELGVVDFERAPPGPTRRRWLGLRNRMALANYGLVVRVAGKARYPRTSTQDNIQYGWIGLLKAVDRFDPERGIRFSTYATYWIRHEIQRAAEKYDRIVRVPTHVRATARKASQLFNQGMHVEEIAKRLHKTPGQVRHALTAMRSEIVSDDALRESFAQNGARRSNGVVADPAPGPEAAAAAEQDLRRLREALRKLPRHEQWLLEQRFGIGTKQRTLQEIGRCQGLSRERIRQIEQVVIRRLRVKLSAAR